MPLVAYKEHLPQVKPGGWIAPDAWLTGQTFIDEDVSIFFGAVLRGDIQKIYIGAGTNLQEHVVVHTSRGLHDCVVGKDVTVGHCAVLHGCKVSDRCIIGMNATILDDAIVGEDCIIGAQTLVPMRMQIPPGSLAFGVPAKVIRSLTEKELKEIKDSAAHYRKVGREYREQLSKIPHI